jgi:hypothetical protein
MGRLTLPQLLFLFFAVILLWSLYGPMGGFRK